MGSPKQPSPPTLDTAQSKALTQADYDLKIKNTPTLTEATGKAGREEYARNLAFALQGFTNPATIFQGQIEDLREANTALNKQLGTEKDAKKKQGIQKQIAANNTRITKFQKSDPVGDLTKAFRGEFKMRDNLLGDMRKAGTSSKEYTAMQRALQRGLTAQQVGQRSAQASQARAAGMGQVADVAAGQVGAGALGDTLMSQAMQRAQSQGQLSSEASRDAVQAARSGMAARGMATGSAGMAAELLNRDRFSRARMAEDLAFAQGVQGQDLSRQFNNVGNTLQADLANQQTQFGREQIISGNTQQANLANMQALNNMAQFNTGLGAETDRFNAMQRTDNQRFNLSALQSSALAADNERARQLGLGQSAYNFALQTNPKMMLSGLGSPYANFTPQALGLMNNTNVAPIYSGGSFGGSGGGFNMAGAGMGALSGAASGAMIGSVVPGIGTAVGAIGGGLIGGLGGGLSDEREKTDIKLLGGVTSVLDLPAYEYRYKGEKKKRKGVMAQDVQKVLPEAVTEVDYQGKKRLAIKPGVIGMALAEELTKQTKAVAA